MPRNLLHRQNQGGLPGGLLNEIRRIAPHHLQPLRLRHLIFPHPEALQANFVRRAFIKIAVRLIRRAAHLKAAARQPNERDAGGRIAPDREPLWLGHRCFARRFRRKRRRRFRLWRRGKLPELRLHALNLLCHALIRKLRGGIRRKRQIPLVKGRRPIRPALRGLFVAPLPIQAHHVENLLAGAGVSWIMLQDFFVKVKRIALRRQEESLFGKIGVRLLLPTLNLRRRRRGCRRRRVAGRGMSPIVNALGGKAA